MVFHFLSRSSSPATNFMNRWRNCKSLPANPWRIIQENAGKSHHAAVSRFFCSPSLKPDSGKETRAGEQKGKKSDHSNRILDLFIDLGPCLLFLSYSFYEYQRTNKRNGTNERVQPVSFEDLSKLLKAGNVERILVTDSLAIVFVWKGDSELPQSPQLVPYEPPESRCMIDIESPESFTEKLEREQAALGIPRPDYVPVTYIDSKNEASLLKI